jgi:NADH:ubiquinone oxidoreductase subunit 2 (subunit N)
LSSLIGVFYYFRVIYALFKEEQSGEGQFEIKGAYLMMLILAGLGSLLIGLYPAWVQSLLS